MADIKYVQLAAADFLADIDFQMMTAEERGVYCSIIFYLYANGGNIKLTDNGAITLLSDSSSKLAIISGCYKTGPEWASLWAKIKHKFIIDKGLVSHKRVTSEIEKARNYAADKSRAGKIGADKRWGSHSTANGDAIAKKSKVKKRNDKHTQAFTLEDVFNHVPTVGFSDDEAEAFFYHYETQGWVRANGLPIINLASAMQYWKKNKHKFATAEEKQAEKKDKAYSDIVDGYLDGR